MIKYAYVIVLLIFLPNICIAEYCEYKELPPLKEFSSVAEEHNLFEKGLNYCIELEIPDESSFYSENIEYCANPFTYEKPFNELKNYIDKAYPNHSSDSYMDRLVSCYKITRTPAYVEEIINILFKYRLHPTMPYRILANHKQSKYYNYLKEKLYSYYRINITDDYEWVKNSGMTYEHIDDKKLQQLKQYSSEILLMKQLIFALCIDKRNPHISFFNPATKSLPKVDDKILQAVYKYADTNSIYFEEYPKNEKHFTNFYIIGYCNDVISSPQVNEYIFSTLDNITK